MRISAATCLHSMTTTSKEVGLMFVLVKMPMMTLSLLPPTNLSDEVAIDNDACKHEGRRSMNDNKKRVRNAE